ESGPGAGVREPASPTSTLASAVVAGSVVCRTTSMLVAPSDSETIAPVAPKEKLTADPPPPPPPPQPASAQLATSTANAHQIPRPPKSIVTFSAGSRFLADCP